MHAHRACDRSCPPLGPLRTLLLVVALLPSVVNPAPPGRRAVTGFTPWMAPGGDAGGSRYSPLTRIDRANVALLQVAWTYRIGEPGHETTFDSTPLLVQKALYLITQGGAVVSLDPTSGRQLWRHAPASKSAGRVASLPAPGLAAWTNPDTAAGEHCRHRIFAGTTKARLLALDGDTGAPCEDFGPGGVVDVGNERNAEGASAALSSPVIYRSLVITGVYDQDGGIALRAHDARNGMLAWTWQPFRAAAHQAEPDAYLVTPQFSVDELRGLIFVPTGARPRSLAATAPDDDSYANALVALKADSGEPLWHQQMIHDDRWGYAIASQPLLLDIEREGRSVAAVAQGTPMGLVFVFDRETGVPVFEVVERAAPAVRAGTPSTSPTQPIPTTPALVSHAAITPEDAWGLTFHDRGLCRRKIQGLSSDGLYTPPTRQGSIQLSGAAASGDSGMAFDDERQLLVMTINHLPVIISDGSQAGDERRLTQRAPLVSQWGLPCTAPPWGTLAAVDARRNRLLWQVPLGSTRVSTPRLLPAMTIGTPNIGGPLLTAGGLVFVAATTDDLLRAFDVDTGRELWKGALPAGGQATPMTYSVDRRQFVVIAAAGHAGLGTTRGDYIVAFSLPADSQAVE